MKKIRIEHPKIYLDAEGQQSDAILIQGHQVIATGKDAKTYVVDEVITPKGACVMPSLTDAHIHMWGLGLRPNSISLRDFTSAEQVYEALRNSKSNNDWVFGHDWNQHQWTDTDALSLEKLDAIFPNQALMLRRIDGHAIWVNTVALQCSHTTSENGLLLDEAMNPVYDCAPPTRLEDDKAAFFETAHTLIDHGITCVHIAWVHAKRVAMLQDLRDRNALPLRVHTMLGVADPGNAQRIAGAPFLDEACWLNFNCLKYFADGALGSKGAQLIDGYEDGSFGEVVDKDADLRTTIHEPALRGWQPAIHAIGDRGAERILDHYDRLPVELIAKIRPRLEHAQMLTDKDVKRMHRYISSIQPIHQYSDCEWADSVLKPFQMDRLFRWRALADVSVLCGGSDYPIEDINPWHGISVAISRAVKNGPPFRSSALSHQEAVAAYTSGAAYAAFWEDKIGKLKEGYCADFIVPDVDPFSSSPEEIWDTRVSQVWLAGQRIR